MGNKNQKLIKGWFVTCLISTKSRFLRVRRMAVLGLTAVAPATVSAADFPSKPVQLQVPFAPGGGADRTFRLFAPYLAEELGVPVKVTNVAGGGGWVSWSQVVNDWNPRRDDHKLAVVNIPHIFSFLNPDMKRTEKLESFNFLAWHSYDPGLWLVRADDERFKDLDDVLEYAQKQAIIVAPGSFGSDDHIGVAFAQQAVPGFKAKFVTSRGDNSKIQLALGGHVDLIAGNVGFFINSIEEGQLRPIAVLHPEPLAVAAGRAHLRRDHRQAQHHLCWPDNRHSEWS